MITTGAAPAAAILMENIKNHPMQSGQQVALGMALSKLSPSISGFAMMAAPGKKMIQDTVKKQYYSNIRSSLSAQNHWNQKADDDNGDE